MSILTFKILHWVWLSDGCDDFVKSIREKGNVDYNKMYIQNRDILSEPLHHASALIIKDIKETSGHKRKTRMQTTFWNTSFDDIVSIVWWMSYQICTKNSLELSKKFSVLPKSGVQSMCFPLYDITFDVKFGIV